MTGQGLTIGLFVLLAAVTLTTHRYRLKLPVESFGAMTANRSSLVAMPVARGRRTTMRKAEAPSSCFGGVIVPSARGGADILHAATTARNANSDLVVLASGRTNAADVEALLARIGWARHRYLVLDFTRSPASALFQGRTFDHPLATRTSDLSHKRNAGLVVARIMGWRSVLFVDDDVQVIGRAELEEAAALLAGTDRGGASRRLVGWAVNEFPDFSAVGHARAHGTDARASFVGGGAMALSCDPTPPFFPPVYNEDMLLWLEMLRHDPGSACVVGTVTQREYDPFDNPRRGADQEFGEVLVEGMIGAAARMNDAVRPEFWRSVLQDRRAMLHQLSVRLTGLGVPNGKRVVHMALDAHSEEWPDLLAAFVADREHDLAVWRNAVAALPRVDRLDQVPALLKR